MCKIRILHILMCKKAHQSMCFYRKLYNFNVDSTLIKMFSSCFIESVLTFLLCAGAVCFIFKI